MNLKSVFPVVGLVAVMGLSCGEDELGNPQGGNQNQQTPAYVGSWLGKLPAVPPLVKDSVRIEVEIVGQDSTYRLDAFYMTGNIPALQHRGTWQSSADSIYLTGTQCAVYDTTTLQLQTRDCGGAIAVPIDIRDITTDDGATKTIWAVSLFDLQGVAAAMRIDVSSPAMQGLLQQISIGLEKN